MYFNNTIITHTSDTHTHTKPGIKSVKINPAPLKNVLLIIYTENKTANKITIK